MLFRSRVGAQIQFDPRAARAVPSTPKFKDAFSSKVAMLLLTPNIPARQIREGLLPGLEGLVLVAFPSGTAPTHDSEFMQLLSDARRRKIPVVVATEGVGVTGSEYKAGKEMLAEGCLWSGAMTPECAYVKAAWLLGQRLTPASFKKFWEKEIAFEGVSQIGRAHV